MHEGFREKKRVAERRDPQVEQLGPALYISQVAETAMQSPAEFSRNHQPAYVPTTNRALAGFLTMGVYALVLVVATHHSPAPHRTAFSDIAAPMEPGAHQQDRQEAFPQTPPQNAPRPQPAAPNAAALSQQTASRQPSFLERLFANPAAAPVPSLAPAPAPGAGQQPAATPSPGGVPAGQLAFAQSPSAKSSSPNSASTSGQQDAPKASKDKASACKDAAWARAITNHVRRFHPVATRQQQAAGTATAHLVIRRSGWLNELEIATTSGNAALDAAAYAMVRKAQPLPRIPDRIAADRIELALPIAFGAAGNFRITVAGCG